MLVEGGRGGRGRRGEWDPGVVSALFPKTLQNQVKKSEMKAGMVMSENG